MSTGDKEIQMKFEELRQLLERNGMRIESASVPDQLLLLLVTNTPRVDDSQIHSVRIRARNPDDIFLSRVIAQWGTLVQLTDHVRSLDTEARKTFLRAAVEFDKAFQETLKITRQTLQMPDEEPV